MTEAGRLALYKESLRIAWGHNDYNDWPVKLNSVMHLFLKEFTIEFLEDLDTIRTKQMSIPEIATAFGNPARLYRLINPLIFGMKRLKMDIDEQRRIVLYLLDIVKAMKYGSEFNEDNRNTIWSPQQTADMCGRLPWKKADAGEAPLIQRFCGMMWAYTESIFFRAHEVTKEVHGPYSIAEGGEKLLVREYLHLAPSEIWPQLSFIPYKTIVIYARYSNTLDVAIDPYNHLFLNHGNYVQDLLSYCVETDNRSTNPEELLSILPALLKTISSVHAWTKTASQADIISRYADIFWYRKSPLRKLAGHGSKVPDAVYANIKTGQADEKRIENLPEEAIDRLISFII